MPYCEINSREEENRGVKLFYKTYGHGKTKVLLIIGFAGTLESWGPQIKGLTSGNEARDEDVAESSRRDEEEEEGIEVCCFDNRGMGRSSIPSNKYHYSTTIMAKDALSLMDHLGWRKAHVFGHSMGGMIACKLASIAPDRLCSLALLNVTGGGYQCFPRIDRQIMSLAFRFLRANTPEERASVDLEVHYTKEYLDQTIGSSTRRKILFQEYVKAMSSAGMQSKHGYEGQVHACWNHKMNQDEIDTIRLSGFPVAIIHGRDDLVAQLYHARRLAERLRPAARMVELHGAHLVGHERPDEVNTALLDLIKVSESKLEQQEWSNLAERESERAMPLSNRNNDGAVVLVTLYSLLAKIQLSFLFFMGFFFMFFGHMRNIVKVLKPVRVLAVES
ncbi:alpha/beta-Hydrolases superfamily protein [Rhynchospora pubera]|uniref:Alpha/beta-Hydrolases superfamily protein n=1 Tax=Rhynchospora pubera TaxID=906938 RepID=A0AAV8HYQ1_9POAL|nr:alpha/beta-Hydrolases superfamily protein [Rhynchospora pubera]